MTGIVAIVGRPNVGKSTLFNRIVGRRVAITLEEPGITRDRIYKAARWQGKEFIVVDTGGLVPGTEVSIERQIKLQVEVAINEADVVIFVVDGREGLTPVDEDIGQSLRKKGKHYLLAVNKIDARAAEPGVNEFHKLGVPFPITAEHGTGVAELLDEAVRRLPPVEPDQGEAVRLVILGRPNVGKSSFLNALLGEYRVIVDDRPGTTRDAIETGFVLDGTRYRVVDTAGLRKKAKVNAQVEYFSVVRAIGNIASSDVAILIVDLTDGPADQDKKIAALVEDAGKGLVIAGNKSDLIPKTSLKTAPDLVRAVLGFVDWAPFIVTSATKKEGVVETIRAATAVFEQAQKKVPDKLLAETVLAEIERRPPAHCQIWSVRQTGVRPPEFTVRVNRPKLDTSYVRFIKHLLRNYFGFQGSPIRIKVASRK